MTDKRPIVAVSIRNNATSAPPLTMTLQKNSPIYRVALLAGQLFLLAEGGVPPYTFAATGLPSALTLGTQVDPDRIPIIGTPASIGHTVFSATVTDSATNTFTSTYAIDVVHQLQWTANAPHRAEDGVPYTYQFAITGATGAVTWALTGIPPNYPTGMSFAASGVLLGTPSGSYPGPYSGTVTVSDAGTGDSISTNYIFLGANALALNLVTGANGSVGAQLSAHVEVGLTTGVAPIRYSIDQASLPSGCTATLGTFSDTDAIVLITCQGVTNSSFTVLAIDSLGAVGSISVPVVAFDPNQQVIMRDGFGDVADPNPATIKIHSSDSSVTVDSSASSGTDIVYDLTTAGGGGGTPYGVASGTNTYVVTLGLSSYTTGSPVVVKFSNANTGASTLNADSLGAKAIQLDGAALVIGNILPGATLLLVYDGTQFQIVGEPNFLSPLTTKGDIYTRTSTADARLPIGADGQVLVADSSQATGNKWTSPAPIIMKFSAVAQSTKFDSTTKLALGSEYFDPNDTKWGLSGTSTATFFMLLETTNASNLAAGDLFQQTGTGSPTTVAAITPTAGTTATLVSVSVSTAFRPGANAGVFTARSWITTNNANDQCTCLGSWLEITP